MKLTYRIIADILFIVHGLLFALVLFGYFFPAFWYAYMTALILAFLSDIIFGYCLLSEWEFNLRKNYNPTIDYNYSFASFYTYKITNQRMSDSFYRWASVIFLGLSILINIYFKFLI